MARKIKQESDLWRYLRTVIKPKIGGHWTRIESHATSLGVPDVNLFNGYHDVWIELKQGEDAEIRPSQYRWIKDRIVEGAKNIWIIHHQEGMGFLLIHGIEVVTLKHAKSKSVWLDCASAVWPDEINPKELEHFICPLKQKMN